MNRGSALFFLRPHSSMTAFNEAPIHESGKCDLRNPGTIGVGAFNEAPIHESGKFHDVSLRDSDVVVALQ